MALYSFTIDGSPFSFFEGIKISGVITLRIVVVVGKEVGTVVAADVDCEFAEAFLSNRANLFSMESKVASLSSLFFSLAVWK